MFRNDRLLVERERWARRLFVAPPVRLTVPETATDRVLRRAMRVCIATGLGIVAWLAWRRL